MESHISDFNEQQAIEAIVYDWLSDNADIYQKNNRWYAEIRLFVCVTGDGINPTAALLDLRRRISDRPSTKRNISTEWLYTSLDLL